MVPSPQVEPGKGEPSKGGPSKVEPSKLIMGAPARLRAGACRADELLRRDAFVRGGELLIKGGIADHPDHSDHSDQAPWDVTWVGPISLEEWGPISLAARDPDLLIRWTGDFMRDLSSFGSGTGSLGATSLGATSLGATLSAQLAEGWAEYLAEADQAAADLGEADLGEADRADYAVGPEPLLYQWSGGELFGLYEALDPEEGQAASDQGGPSHGAPSQGDLAPAPSDRAAWEAALRREYGALALSSAALHVLADALAPGSSGSGSSSGSPWAGWYRRVPIPLFEGLLDAGVPEEVAGDAAGDAAGEAPADINLTGLFHLWSLRRALSSSTSPGILLEWLLGPAAWAPGLPREVLAVMTRTEWWTDDEAADASEQAQDEQAQDEYEAAEYEAVIVAGWSAELAPAARTGAPDQPVTTGWMEYALVNPPLVNSPGGSGGPVRGLRMGSDLGFLQGRRPLAEAALAGAWRGTWEGPGSSGAEPLYRSLALASAQERAWMQAEGAADDPEAPEAVPAAEALPAAEPAPLILPLLWPCR